MGQGEGDLYEIIATPAFALTCFRIRPGVVDEGGVSGNSSTGGTTNGSLTPSSASAAASEAAVDPAFEPPADNTVVNESSASKGSEEVANALTKRVADLITDRGEVFLMGPTVAGKTCIRVVSANPYAEEKYIRLAWEEIVQTTEEVLGAWRQGKVKLELNGHGEVSAEGH